MAVWTAAGGVAIAAGPVVGGLLLDGLGWRSIFLVNLPLCVLAIWLTFATVPEPPRPGQRPALESRGAAARRARAHGTDGGHHRDPSPRARASARPVGPGARGGGRPGPGGGGGPDPGSLVAPGPLPPAGLRLGGGVRDPGEPHLLRGDLRPEPVPPGRPRVPGSRGGAGLPPAHGELHPLQSRERMDDGTDGLARADDLRRARRRGRIRPALPARRGQSLPGDASGLPPHSPGDGPGGASDDDLHPGERRTRSSRDGLRRAEHGPTGRWRGGSGALRRPRRRRTRLRVRLSGLVSAGLLLVAAALALGVRGGAIRPAPRSTPR